VSSVAGILAGKTKVTVSPSKSANTNKYKYTTSATDITLPDAGDNLSAWTTWNGSAEIIATNGYYIAVAETEADYSCVKVGKTQVQSLLATSTAGSYNSGTGTWSSGGTTYSLTQETGNNVKVTGTLPLEEADAVLGLPAGNRFAVKIKNNSIVTKASLPSGTIAKISNPDANGGFNTYTKSAFEDDGSLIVIINAPAGKNTLVVKITWTTGVETTYTYDLTSATRATQ